jgi:hypothetical protein
MVDKDAPFMLLMRVLFSLVVMYTVLSTPLTICYPWMVIDVSGKQRFIDFLIEFMYFNQILFNFITADRINGITNFKEAFLSYWRSGVLFLDLTATLPSLVLVFMNRRDIGKYFMLIRFIYWGKFFFPFELLFERIEGLNPVTRAKYMRLA